MFCVQCGEKLPDNARFCSSCGAKVPGFDPSAALGRDDEIPAAPAASQQPAPINPDELIEYIEYHAFQGIQQSDIYNKYFYSCHSPIPNSRRQQFQRFREVYRQASDQGELFLFYYDNTLIGNAKESFLLTDWGIHASSDRLFSGVIPYQDIQTIEIKAIKMFPNIVINRRFMIPIRFMYDECYEFVEDLQNIVIPILMELYN